MDQEQKRKSLLFVIAAAGILFSFLINVKNIYTSCQCDAEYQIAMAYRLLQGDRMFYQMWEAHQTSAFFLAFFEWIYLKAVGSTAGIVVYANTVGILCRTAVAFCVFGTLRRFVGKLPAYASLLFLLNTYPKDVMLPDFSNLQIWFGLLLMCCLIWYFQQGKVKWLALGALCLCVQTVCYPGCAAVWIFCVVLLGRYSDKKRRDICLFTGICVLSAVLYLGHFIMEGNLGQFLQNLYYIWSGDESHAVGLSARLALIGEDVLLFLQDLCFILPVAACAFAAALLGRAAVKKRSGKIRSFREVCCTGFCWFLALYILGYLVHLPWEELGTKHHFFIFYIIIEAAAWLGKKYLNPAEKKIFVTGQLIGFGGIVATVLLSDMGIFPSLPYLIPAVCVSFLPLSKLWEESGAGEKIWKNVIPAALICAVMMFRNLIYLNGWMTVPENFREDSIFGITYTARFGPLEGIRGGEGAYVQDTAFIEWQDLIHDGDRVLVLSYPNLPSAMYLNRNVVISQDSTISTPTYSERLFQYWEQNPDKYPNVVVVRCFNGSPMIGEYSEVIQWLEQYPATRVVDGAYWRYYFMDEKR